MAYSYNTSVYQFPTMQTGDIAQGTEEKRKSDILESMIEAISRIIGGASAVIAEGSYVGAFVTGASTVTLTSLQAFINGVYVSGSGVWTGIANSTTSYLMIKLVEDATYSSRQYRHWTPYWNTTGTIPANAHLVAIATTTGSAITINESPSAKRWIEPMFAHEGAIAITRDAEGNVTSATEGDVTYTITRDSNGDVTTINRAALNHDDRVYTITRDADGNIDSVTLGV